MGFLGEFLGVVLAEVVVLVLRRIMEGEDFLRRFEFRDGDEADGSRGRCGRQALEDGGEVLGEGGGAGGVDVHVCVVLGVW